MQKENKNETAFKVTVVFICLGCEEYNPVKVIVDAAKAGIVVGDTLLGACVAIEVPAAFAAELTADVDAATAAGMSTEGVIGSSFGVRTCYCVIQSASVAAVPVLLDQATKITFCKICNKNVKSKDSKPCQRFVDGKMEHELL